MIVEPSGIYDVDEFFDTLHEEPLDGWYQIGNVITVLDSNLEENLPEGADFLLASGRQRMQGVLFLVRHRRQQNRIRKMRLTI